MVFNYTNTAQVALDQIADKGRNVSLVYKTSGTYDPQLDSVVGASENTVTVKAVIRNYSQRDMDGTLIKKDDQEVLIAASGITKPQSGDLIIDAEELTIVDVREVKPGATAIMYKLQVRR